MEWTEWLTTVVSVLIASAVVWRWKKRRTVDEATDEATSDDKYEKDTKLVAIHDIVSDRNGNGTSEKVSYNNPTFKHSDESPVFTQPLKCSKEDFGKPRQMRQISDLSEVFRLPCPDEKSLSELVIEEFDNKSKTLRAGESGDFSGYRTGDSDTDVSDIEIDEGKNHENIDTENTQNTSSSHGRDVPMNDSMSHDGTPDDKVQVEIEASATNQPAKSTEWRDKLKHDLLDDDDEEFMDDDTSNDSEDRDTASLSVTSVSDESDNEGDKNDVSAVTKGARPSAKSLTSQSSTYKLLRERALVIDNGSYLVRGGWAGEFTPTTCVRNVIGHWRAEASEAWREALGSKFIGDTAIERHSTLALDNPIDDGKIVNWKGLQEVWSHMVSSEMDEDPTQHPVLITEPAHVDKKQREKMVEVMIESLRVPGVSLRSQAVMCGLSSGHKVGLVVNSGYGTTEIVPVYEGYHLDYATTTMAVGGRHITDYLARLMQREHGTTFTSVSEMEIINSIKETHAVVQGDRQRAMIESSEYQLPDGQVIQLGNELSLCTEPMFNSGLVGNSSLGLPTLVKQTIERIPSEIMSEANNVILLAGGNSKLDGLQARLQSEVNDKVGGAKITIQSSSCGENAAWIGGSISAEQFDFPDSCITEDLYFENGAKIVHRLCI